ncbi:penicillin-binding protein activator [Marinomonas agarivorans]|nr:penicillin-binding protein activator [Marinomonas agarivorans]
MNRLNFYILTLSCLSVLLAACGTSSPKLSSNSAAVSANQINLVEDPFTRFIQLAEKADSAELTINYYFEAALLKYSLQERDIALQILEDHVVPYSHPNQLPALLLIADIYSENDQAFYALDALFEAKSLPQASSLQNRIKISQKRVIALEALGSWNEVVKERISLSALLPTEELDNNEKHLWVAIQNLTDSEVTDLQGSQDQILEGWLYLSTVLRSKTATLGSKKILYDQWKTSTPYHPAALNPPEDFTVLADLETVKLTNIGIALPMTGRLSVVSQAIIDGLLAAYYSEDNIKKPQLTFINTSNYESVDAILQEAQAKSLDIIIGPLRKNLVAQLSQNDLPFPVIALNQIENSTFKENLHYFSLSSEDDIRELILFAKQEGATRAAILGLTEKWALRQAEEFKKVAQQEGIEILDTIAYENKPSERATAVKKLLLVNESQKRKQQIQKLLDLPVDSIDRSRLDLDYVYFIGHLDDAKQIRPSLDFYFAEDIPMLASNTINNTSLDSKDKAQDAERILFTEVPALVKTNAIMRRIEKKVSGNILKRLQAMGADAYILANRYWIFHRLPNAKMSANTGLLTMDEHGIFHKRPELVLYKSGKLTNAKNKDIFATETGSFATAE